VTLAYRRVLGEGSLRPVSLIVFCAECNREVGWAWHDDGQVLWWPLVANADVAWETEPRAKAVQVQGMIYRWGRELRAGTAEELNEPGRIHLRCPADGKLITPEINPAELSPETTRRIRAPRSTTR
jgi:hypothetical protein